MYSAPIALKYNTSHPRSSGLPGAISFLIICLALFYFIYNIVVEAASEGIIVNTKYYETIAGQVDSYQLPMVAISVDGLNKTEF